MKQLEAVLCGLSKSRITQALSLAEDFDGTQSAVKLESLADHPGWLHALPHYFKPSGSFHNFLANDLLFFESWVSRKKPHVALISSLTSLTSSFVCEPPKRAL